MKCRFQKSTILSFIMTAERKLKERLALARRIEDTGLEMLPCSYCEKNNRKCVVGESSDRCSECVRRKGRCDAAGPSAGDLESVIREEERIEREEELTEARMTEAAAKLSRLRKQKRFLRTRAREMLRRGLQSLDELDEAERKETEEKEKSAEAERAQAVNAELFPFGQIPSGFLDDVPWADLDFGGENLPASQDN